MLAEHTSNEVVQETNEELSDDILIEIEQPLLVS